MNVIHNKNVMLSFGNSVRESVVSQEYCRLSLRLARQTEVDPLWIVRNRELLCALAIEREESL